MCGRFALGAPRKILKDHFRTLDEPEESLERWNVAPGTDVPAVVLREDGRRFASFRWGLVPFWAKDEKVAWKFINIRAETAATKPAFSRAVHRRRCLIPATGFYEWRAVKADGKRGRKEPWFYRLKKNAPLALAGVWESWIPPERHDAPPLFTCSILTTEANELVAPVHERMPVIVDEADYGLWLGEEVESEETYLALLKPYPAEKMTSWRVGSAVNRTGSEGPELVRPVGREEEPGGLLALSKRTDKSA